MDSFVCKQQAIVIAKVAWRMFFLCIVFYCELLIQYVNSIDVSNS